MTFERVAIDQRFTHRTYRCEWQVQLGTVDQYGQNFNPYAAHGFPTREAAIAFRPTVAKQHEYVKERWVPLDDNGYRQCEIVYREIEIERWKNGKDG